MSAPGRVEADVTDEGMTGNSTDAQLLESSLMATINGRKVSAQVLLGAVVLAILVFGAVAYLMIFRKPLGHEDARRIETMLRDGTWSEHIRDGAYYGHSSCDWGSTTTVSVTVESGEIRAVEVVTPGRSSSDAGDAFRRQVVQTQSPPFALERVEDRGLCEMRGAIRNALMRADYDNRTRPYHPASREPPRGP